MSQKSRVNRKLQSSGCNKNLRAGVSDAAGLRPIRVVGGSVEWYVGMILSGLVSLTLFLSGDLNERNGIVHILAILWLVFAVILTAIPILIKGQKTRLVFTRFDLAIYIFFLLTLLSAFWNLFHGGAPRPSINMVSVWILGATSWFIFRQLLNNARTVAAIFAVVTAVFFAESILAVYQQTVEIPKIKRMLKEDPIRVVKESEPNIEHGTPAWQMIYSRLVTALPVGTYPLSNTLGGLLGCWLIFLLGHYTQSKLQDKSSGKLLNNLPQKNNTPLDNTPYNLSTKPPNCPQQNESDSAKEMKSNALPFSVYQNQIIIGLFTLILLAGFIFTKCRSGFVAVAFGFLLLVVMSVRHRLGRYVRRFIFLAAVLLVVGAVAISLTAGKDLFSGAKKSFGFRLEYWAASLSMIRDYPIFGCGTGNFKHTYTQYKLPISSEEISDPHNFAFEIAATIGIPAFVIFVVAVSMICVCCRRSDEFGQSEMITDNIADRTDSTEFDKINDAELIAEESVKNSVKISCATKNASATINQIRDDSLWYLVGGLVGCYVAYFVSMISESPLAYDSVLAATVVFVLFGLIDVRSFERVASGVILVVLAVLFVHLSAAGGISLSNTAILIWLLLSVLVNRFVHAKNNKTPSSVTICPANNKPNGSNVTKKTDTQLLLRYVISVFLIVTAVLINLFGFRPVVDTRMITDKLAFENDAIERVKMLREAVKKDPYSAFIQEQLARMAMYCYVREPHNRRWYETAIEAQNAAMRLAPRSGMIRYGCAEIRAESWRRLNNIQNKQVDLSHGKFRDVDLVESSLDIYRDAIKFYPNNAAIHAAFATTLFQLGKINEAKTQAEIAIDLDDQMTHIEIKLNSEQRTTLQHIRQSDSENDQK